MLKKLQLRPGMNQENTRYTNENGWWIGDKVRFRQGTPEKIGGWARLSSDYFLGVCRSLIPWVALDGFKLVGVGTNLKYYVENGGVYYDITPIRTTATLTNPFSTTLGLTTVTVTHTAHGAITGDFVTFSGASTVGSLNLNGEYQITKVDDNSYTITALSSANATATGGGTVTAAYQINVGPEVQTPSTGWGASTWSSGGWGTGVTTYAQLRTWSGSNFGEDLVFAPYGGAIYYWDFTSGLYARAVRADSLTGASDVPLAVNAVLVSDTSRFVIAFGCNELGSLVLDPMLIRWSDQESVTNWTPAAINQAGGVRLSTGSEIVARLQIRQEIVVWTDAAVYAMQYVGPPFVWNVQLMADNVSIVGPNAVATVSGVAYWMGHGKFYKYDGRVQTLPCDLRQYVFQNINETQLRQCFAGTNEAFHEIWWFYPSENSTVPDKYVVYNYLENIWYTGNMTRYAWVDKGVQLYPMAAGEDRIIYHEYGVDDNSGATAAPIAAYVESAEFDIDDGDKFGFVWRLLPDITFRGSTANNPSTTFTLYPMKNSGTGYGNSVGGDRFASVTRSVSVPVEEFTGQVYIRVRGRQMVIKVESADLGVTWQLGSPRIDIKVDGRR